MQSVAVALPTSFAKLIKSQLPSKPFSHLHGLNPVYISCSQKPTKFISINGGFAFSFPTHLSLSPSSHFNSSFCCRRHGRPSDFLAKASSVPKIIDDAAADSSSLIKPLELACLMALWYTFNIYLNINNKQVLKVFPFPITVTASQFGVGAVLALMTLSADLHKKPNLSPPQVAAILPVAVAHTLGNLFTNISLGKVAVSFTHTIKAMEPFFAVLMSGLFLGQWPTPWVLLSLVPIVSGVALASATEAAFNWAGFWSAMASNVTNQSRNVISKKLMIRDEEPLDNITLFSIMTVMSFLLLAPAALLIEGVRFTPSYLESAGLNVKEVYLKNFIAGFSFHAYQQLSYIILERVTPVTHSVSNCVKRVVVIVATVIFFRTPVSTVNALGTSIALAGVFLYSRVKPIKPKMG